MVDSSLSQEKENTQHQPTLATTLSHLSVCVVRGGEAALRSNCEFICQRHTLTKRLRPNPSSMEGFPPPTPRHNLTKGLFTAVPFSQCIMSDYHNKLHNISKGKKHNLMRKRKHQRQTWQGGWNYQTRNLKRL